MKTKKLFTSLSFLTIALGAFSFATALKENNQPDFAVTEAWSLDVKPSVDASYYSAADGKTGSQLRNALADFNKPTSPSYDWSRYEAADEAQDDSNSILCVYTRHNIPKNGHCGSYSWNTWNREHVYTQSKFPNSDKDNHNIFACEGQINNTRGNLPYDEVQGKSGASRISEFGHTTDCYYISGTSFEPCDEAKGEIARACLYCTIYYGYDLSQIFVDKNIALKWNAMYPVTAREIYRNNVVYTLQGNRNPFIDHPSYAQKIYDGPAYQGTDPLDAGGVTISPSSASVVKGNTVSLTAVASDSSAITWSTSDSTVATVTQLGVVTGVKVGTATITATASCGSASATITVTEPKTLSSISVSGQKTAFVINSEFSFGGTVTAHYNDSTTADVTSSATFSGYNLANEGNQTVTVSYTEGGVNRTTTYNITVSSTRVVYEETESVIGTIAYTSGSEVVSVSTLSTSKSGYTNIENAPDDSHQGLRLGSGSDTGTLTITSTTSNIRKVVVNARNYSNDSTVEMKIGGTSNTLTSSYSDYTKEYTTATNSVAINTTTKKKRAWISVITVSSISMQDISTTADCIGLETFITSYMHMDYTENLGYCSDNEHHYYATAKAAFNDLNNHQRSLFTSNSAYLAEWTRLSTWASKNGDLLSSINNKLIITSIVDSTESFKSNSALITIIVVSALSTCVLLSLLISKKRRYRK